MADDGIFSAGTDDSFRFSASKCYYQRKPRRQRCQRTLGPLSVNEIIGTLPQFFPDSVPCMKVVYRILRSAKSKYVDVNTCLPQRFNVVNHEWHPMRFV